ncbi:hypothetical protein A20C1_12752 [marine actinobacterium PHSC20C1]|nr:hypothetical protein A20C1_12752 [marine actinobacterium PHSC20C1]
MLLDRIQIFGYRRMVDASAYVGRKTVALVGPNEAGKSSVLSALRLFGDDSPVPPLSFSRATRGQARDATDDVVILSLALTAEQLSILKGMPLSVLPTHYTLHKQIDGTRRYSFLPFPEVDPAIRKKAADGWPKLAAVLEVGIDSGADDADAQTADLDSVGRHFLPGVYEEEVFKRVHGRIVGMPFDKQAKKVQSAIAAFEEYFRIGRPDLNLRSLIRAELKITDPVFAMFGDRERDIEAEYEIAGADTESSVALANLLALAGLSLTSIRQNLPDAGYLEQLVNDANDRLSEYFASKWSQESVAVGLKVDGDVLRVFVKDVRPGSVGWINITERSDGLRMFVALATFLARQEFATPPILLIDEAEQHLHLNAQGDLVRMLQELEQIQQVLYTTHSPGCLPADLGNGVRFVEPLDGGRSRIRHDFWSLRGDDHVGFNPLLMLMGAGAAAFSGLRNALVVEGASDMLLLPTFIKIATGQRELSYQVAPGISVASKGDLARMDLVASRVAYLVDGDPAGNVWRGQLELAGVAAARIRQLAAGSAIEDLLDLQFYVDTVNDFLTTQIVSAEELDGVGAVKGQLDRWSAARNVTLPGPIVVAEQMLGNHETGRRRITLNPSKKQSLKALHAWAVDTFAAAR